MKDSKNLVIGMLCAVVCIMAVAFAAFQTQLTVNGTASIESNWKVAFEPEENIADCELHSAAGGTTGVTASVNRVSDALATINMTFSQPGDYAICTINVENKGSLNAKLNFDTDGTTTTELVKFTLTGTDQADTKIAANTGRHPIVVKGEFLDVKVEGTNDSKPITEANKSANLSIIMQAEQDFS